MNKNTQFWNWAGNPDSRELYLYGTIAESGWYDDDVTPQMFRDELMKGEGPITVWLNSYGGDCAAASQIYTMLIDYPYDVTIKIDGIAASAASVIAMAGTKVLMAPTACLMVHDPATVAMGNTSDMEQAIRQLEAVKESIIDAYEIKTGISRKKIADLMTAETFMDCHKAIELGFADGILERTVSPVHDYSAPTLFSQRSVDMALVNKISGKDDADNHPGIPAKPLYERLEKLNHHR